MHLSSGRPRVSRAIWNAAAAPMAEQLGFSASPIESRCDARCAVLSSGDTRVGLLAGHWTRSLDHLWRDAVRSGMGHGWSWALCTNGHQLRLVDARARTRAPFFQFDLEHTIERARRHFKCSGDSCVRMPSRA